MRLMKRQQLLVGGLSLASLLFVACDDRLKLLSELLDTSNNGPTKPTDPATPKPDTGSGPGACVTNTQGDPTSCKDNSAWKEEAFQVCQKAGLSLVEHGLSEACGADTYRYVKFTCCKAEAPSPAPTPTPTPSKCISDTQGDPTTCMSNSAWKDQASQVCQKAGLSLSDLGMSEECGDGGFRYVKFICCEAEGLP
jgi:hypothetical protein